MYGNLIFLLLLISINGQYDDDRDFPRGRHSGRHSKGSFDAKFQRGRCPDRFYQLGDECVYFSADGKIYSWKQAQRECSRRIARLLDDHPHLKPIRGVRQLVLNTPEKTEIFRSLHRKHHEQNFAVRLPSDYNTLPRCSDGKDDKWPQYCTAPTQDESSTCFETISHGENNDICLREVDCHFGYLRLACEFTLPGGAEITYSKFRNCPPTPAPTAPPPAAARDLPVAMWKWIAIGVICVVIIIIIIGLCIRKGKGYSRARTS